MNNLEKLLQALLRRYEVTTVQELLQQKLSKLKFTKTPEIAVKNALENEEVAPHLQEINEFFKIHRLSHVLDFEYYDEINMIYQTGSGYGFILEATTLTGVSENTSELLTGLFNVGIPEGACIQFLLHASSELDGIFSTWRNQRQQSPLYQTIQEERVKFLKQGTKDRLFPKNKMCVRNFRLLITFTFEGVFSEENTGMIENIRNASQSLLKSQGIETRNIQPEGFINFCREILCPKQKDWELTSYDDTLPIRDQISDPDNNIYIDTDGIVINDTAIRSLGVKKYPTQLYLQTMGGVIGDQFSSMLQIPYPFLFCCNIQVLSPEKTNGKLIIEAERVQNQARNGIGRFVPIINRKAGEYKLAQQILADGEGFVNFGHFFHIYTPLGKSEEAYQEVQAVFRSKNFELVNYSNIQFPAVLSSLPLFFDPDNANELKEARMMRLYRQFNAMNSIPVLADWKGTGTPLLLTLGRRGQVQFTDVFDNIAGNYNFSVAAVSGSGKSYLMNELAASYLSCNSLVRIIDIGKSYKNLCEIFEGQFIEFSDKSKICINPFSYIADSHGNDLAGLEPAELIKREEIKEQIEMLKSIVILAAGRDPNDKTEDSFVEQAILNAIAKQGSKSTFTTVYNELLALQDDKGRAKDIAQAIHSYTDKGIHGIYFEGVANLNFNNSFIVLELEELRQKGKLVDVVLLIVMLRITQEMYLGDRSQKKVCIIDEAWDLMGNGNSGKFIETGYRRARKYGGAFGTATQSIDDYFKNDTTKACWNNADIKFLLRQGAESKNVKFDEYTERLLKSLNTEKGVYSEMVVEVGGKTCGVARLTVDPFSNYIYSSNANDVQFVKYIRDFKKVDVAQAVVIAIKFTDLFHKTYRADKSEVSRLMVQQIRSQGYENTINELVVISAVKDYRQNKIEHAIKDTISIIELYAKFYNINKENALQQISDRVEGEGIEKIITEINFKY